MVQYCLKVRLFEGRLGSCIGRRRRGRRPQRRPALHTGCRVTQPPQPPAPSKPLKSPPPDHRRRSSAASPTRPARPGWTASRAAPSTTRVRGAGVRRRSGRASARAAASGESGWTRRTPPTPDLPDTLHPQPHPTHAPTPTPQSASTAASSLTRPSSSQTWAPAPTLGLTPPQPPTPSPHPPVCQYRCIVSYETQQFTDFSLCILQKHNCRGLSAEPPVIPSARPGDGAGVGGLGGRPGTDPTAALRGDLLPEEHAPLTAPAPPCPHKPRRPARQTQRRWRRSAGSR
jgi:hypothetical protein